MLEKFAKWLRGNRLPKPPDHIIYAVGDIHGRCDLLAKLVSAIAEEAPATAELIFIGDYIDRGPDSAQVVQFLLTDPALRRFKPIFLKGNHEAALLDFLERPEAGPGWARFGGLDTLASYGVRVPGSISDLAEWERARQELTYALSGGHREFYETLRLGVERGCYLFVHAGVDPRTPIAEQGEAQFLWIRQPFLTHDGRLERIIVHGHTPEPEPVWNHCRIGIDTGAYASGRLTAVRIDGADVRFIST